MNWLYHVFYLMLLLRFQRAIRASLRGWGDRLFGWLPVSLPLHISNVSQLFPKCQAIGKQNTKDWETGAMLDLQG
ncbi:hypothetical protein NIES4072_31050 [Nostoc commune NIES-4072]|uniref:Uncharacterized protein n=1 Tax=Nostoc commune NIES-4072 TaxID=2005467 RepID=A0A2R5FKX8_NOSCO|nr:hypothetical protein NIES4072_31050 [Nostoc commune NIES-4072]